MDESILLMFLMVIKTGVPSGMPFSSRIVLIPCKVSLSKISSCCLYSSIILARLAN